MILRVKGHEFDLPPVKDSFNRRAVQFKNEVGKQLHQLGVGENQWDVPLEQFALKKAPAQVTFYLDGHRLFFKYDGLPRYVDNLAVVLRIITLEVTAVLSGNRPINEFFDEFKEDDEVEDKRKQARAVLGLEEGEKDFDVINKKYKKLSKEHHPDAGGSAEKFKEINDAHNTLKRELV